MYMLNTNSLVVGANLLKGGSLSLHQSSFFQVLNGRKGEEEVEEAEAEEEEEGRRGGGGGGGVLILEVL